MDLEDDSDDESFNGQEDDEEGSEESDDGDSAIDSENDWYNIYSYLLLFKLWYNEFKLTLKDFETV